MSPLSLKAIGGAAAIYLSVPLQPVLLVPNLPGISATGSTSVTPSLPPQHPPGVPQYNFDMCVGALMNPAVTITITGPVENNGARIHGLPSVYMVLGTVIDGEPAGGPVPTPCGSACLLYNNLNAGDYGKMQDILTRVKNL
ncbi:hypothetical protein GB937_005336 [Aspergillus fischeri]|nr:hypothetical protein GB937_005336 [Aspergillus fischeri]